MACKAVVFDLDGTLIDSLEDIADAANRVLTSRGSSTHSYEAFKHLVGEGVGRLFEKALPAADEAEIAACIAGFQTEYADGWHRKTKPYPGVPEMLDSLSAVDLRLGVLSNKPHAFSTQCVDRILADWRFASVLGQRDDTPRKPDPAGLLKMLAEWNIDVGDCLYVGDTSTDMQTAKAAGAFAVGVSWGFRSTDELRQHGADRIIDQPAELVAMATGS